MIATSGPVGLAREWVVLAALIALSFGVLCMAALPASALEYEPAPELVDVEAAAPARASLYGTAEKWSAGLERTASYRFGRFGESDIRDTGLTTNHQATWLLGARVKLSGHDLFLADDKLSLSVGVPLQTTSGRVTVLNNIFVRSKRDMRVRDLVLSLVNQNLWSVAASHKVPLAYKPLNFGYGVYAQFRGSELRHIGLGFSGRLKF